MLQLLLFTYAGFLVLKKKLWAENTISLDTDWFYRKGGVIFVRIIDKPIRRGTQWTIDATLAVKDFAVWFSKNPAEALGIVVDKWKGSIDRTPFHLPNKGSIHRTLF